MSETTGLSNTATTSSVILETNLDGPVMLPNGFAVADASFERSGEDLVLTASDGTNVIVSDFFASDPTPSLATPNGALVSGVTVDLLAGSPPSDQVIEAGTDAANEPIGTINTISGKAFVVRVDGTRVELDVNTPLYAGDILETTPDGAIGVILADETTLAMGGDGRMVLDEMIYDPGTQEGSLSLVALKGVYTIVSGLVSKTDPDAMTINTPVGSIGIRGTQIGIDFSDGENLTVVMMREADGYVGEVFIRNQGGVQVMNEVNQVLFAGAYTRPPVFMASVEDSDILRMFETTLMHLPMTTGRANDYTTQKSEGGGELDAFTTDAGTATEDAPPPEEVIRVTAEEYTTPPPPAPVAAPPSSPQPLDPVVATLPVDDGRAGTTLVTTEPFASAGIVVAPNADPIADNQAVTTSEDQPLSGQLSATDADQDTLSYALTEGGAPGHGSVVINADGSYTYMPPADFSGTDSFSYTVSDGEGGTTTATVSINVAAVPDVPVVSVSAASGAEDTAIALTISATVPGSEEIVSLSISGVPDGATLNAGIDNGDGSWTLIGDDLNALDSLTLTPPADWSGDIALTVGATSTDGGTATAGFGVAVTAVPDLPVVSVSAASGAEDTAIALTISATVPGSESLSSLTISGVPGGATLSAGIDNGNGSWTLSGDDLTKLGTLTLTPPANSSDDISLSVTATSSDGGTASASFGVFVAAVADAPVLQVSDSVYGYSGDGGEGGEGNSGEKVKGTGGDDILYGSAGSDVIIGKGGADILYGYGTDGNDGSVAVVPITITAGLSDLDSSESLGIAITGVPDGATLSAGTDLGSGLWTLNPDQLDGLNLTLPEDYQGDFQLAVTSTTTDVDPDTGITDQATASATINVAFEGGEGSFGNDLLKGGGGDDILYGGGGADVLKGEGGDDILYGGTGDDELRGEGGDDVLVGGAGDDSLKGGGGKDTFVFDAQAGRDIIEDFREGEVLRFEGPEFSADNLSVSQSGDNVSVMFEGQAVEVTINDLDLKDQSYSVTQDGDAVLITFEGEN
ncbi:MAG: tandem-95 repeat protein [Rhodospirillales bacterium]|nr:tandem-95 repeat protein [Rhodospirillales bacterium]